MGVEEHTQKHQNEPIKHHFLPSAGSGRGVSIVGEMVLEQVWQPHICKGRIQAGGWGVPACRFEILQFVAMFATVGTGMKVV